MFTWGGGAPVWADGNLIDKFIYVCRGAPAWEPYCSLFYDIVRPEKEYKRGLPFFFYLPIRLSNAKMIEGAPAHGSVAHLLPQTYKRLVSEWLEEDTPSFDYGGFVVGEEVSEAKLLGKSEGIVAGVPFFDEVFRQLDCA